MTATRPSVSSSPSRPSVSSNTSRPSVSSNPRPAPSAPRASNSAQDWFDQVTGTSSQSRDIAAQNLAAVGHPLTQQSINDAQSRGVVLSSPDHPTAARDSGQGVAAQQTLAPMTKTATGSMSKATGNKNLSTTQKPSKSGGDYADVILDAAFGGGKPPTAAATTGKPGKVAPIPQARPVAGNSNEERELEQKLADGYSLQDLALGAGAGGIVGASVALLARKMLSSRGQGSVSVDPTSPNSGIGKAPKTNTVHSVPMHPEPRIVNGQPINSNIIDGSFQVLGQPEPTLLPGQQYRLTPGSSPEQAPVTQGVTPRGFDTSIPGANYKTTPKQLGDMDSPNWRDQMIPGSAQEAAKRIKDQMDMYGGSIADYGVSETVRPAVYREIMKMIN